MASDIGSDSPATAADMADHVIEPVEDALSARPVATIALGFGLGFILGWAWQAVRMVPHLPISLSIKRMEAEPIGDLHAARADFSSRNMTASAVSPSAAAAGMKCRNGAI